MFSIRSTMVSVVMLVVAMICGCQRIVPPATRSPVNDSPIVVDEAMQVRDFSASRSYYANGDAIAGGTGYIWQTHETVAPGYRRWADAPVAVVNIVAMPIGMFVNNPWQAEVQTGEQVPPSHTASPPVPGRPLPTARSNAVEEELAAPQEAPPQPEVIGNETVAPPQ